MKVKELKAAVKVFDEFKDDEFVKEMWSYNEYLFYVTLFIS
jgi:hypothetical protein